MKDYNYELITSRSNQFITEIAGLSDKKRREESSLFTFEGIKLFREALQKDLPLTAVLVTEKNKELLSSVPHDKKTRKIIVSDSVYEKITNENSPQGVFCVSKYLDNLHKFATIYNIELKGTLFCVVGVRDPGNLGTIIRCAYALGIDSLVLSSDCADIYNPKTVRASMGSLFEMNTIKVPDIIDAVKALGTMGYDTSAAALDESAESLLSKTVNSRTCFIVGNEGSGLPNDLLSVCSSKVYIPMIEGAESLNVASASSILLWKMTEAINKK